MSEDSGVPFSCVGSPQFSFWFVTHCLLIEHYTQSERDPRVCSTLHTTSISSETMYAPLIFFLWICVVWLFPLTSATIFTLQMHHRFSDPVKEWSRRSRTNFPAHKWPEKGSVEYYALLAGHDLAVHGRTLSSLDRELTFSDGNATFRISSLGL